jgi:hypothetical protein
MSTDSRRAIQGGPRCFEPCNRLPGDLGVEGVGPATCPRGTSPGAAPAVGDLILLDDVDVEPVEEVHEFLEDLRPSAGFDGRS